jgi:branched-chain amino acid transport system ATP-binding protein
MLKLNNIEVFFVKVIQVLRGVSMDVEDGKIVALLGANGAGKSTTAKAITGMLSSEEGEITSGSIEFKGKRVDRMSSEKIVGKMGIVMVWEGRRVLEHLDVEENLMLGGYAVPYAYWKKKKEQLDLVYNYFPSLRHIRHRTAGYLSGGEQQMVVVGSALMARPQVLILDEPSMGLAPLVVKDTYEIITKINSEQKTTTLLVEQNANMALSVADHGYVMENGKIVLDGPADKLSANEDIKEFYLGLSQIGQRKSFREVKHYRRRKRWL